MLALQGDVERHLVALADAGATGFRVRTPEDLARAEGLILPGGESTTIGMLLERFELMEPLRARIGQGLPVLGTCAGVILLADAIEGSSQPRIGGLDVTVRRNAYGRQVDSFETAVSIPLLGAEPVPGVFIRAPGILRAGPGVEVLASTDAGPVLVRQDTMLGCTFHPELTGDTRIHRFFAGIVRGVG